MEKHGYKVGDKVKMIQSIRKSLIGKSAKIVYIEEGSETRIFLEFEEYTGGNHRFAERGYGRVVGLENIMPDVPEVIKVYTFGEE